MAVRFLIVTMTESQRIEYKSALSDSLEKEVIAFLNAKEGGVIYWGVDDQGKTLGLQDITDVQLRIKNRLKHNIEILKLTH